MSSNFERLQKIINQAYAENFSFLFHVEPRNLPRSPNLWPRWSGPFMFHFLEGCKVSFSVMINSYIGMFDLSRKYLPWKKTKQRKFCEKNSRFVVSEFMKTCDELDLSHWIRQEHNLRQPCADIYDIFINISSIDCGLVTRRYLTIATRSDKIRHFVHKMFDFYH
jgi:hypothetical protein